jgi:hypothetical protein
MLPITKDGLANRRLVCLLRTSLSTHFVKEGGTEMVDDTSLFHSLTGVVGIVDINDSVRVVTVTLKQKRRRLKWCNQTD